MTLTGKEPIEEFLLSPGLISHLKNRGVATIEDLCSKKAGDLGDTFARVTSWQMELRLKLAREGLALEGETPSLGVIEIQRLFLPSRVRSNLKRVGFDYAEQLCEYSQEEVLAIGDFGPKSLELVRISLAALGLALKGESTYTPPPEYELDSFAKGLKKVGVPGIVAFARRGENYLTLQLQSPHGNQLELRRPAPGVTMSGGQLIKHLRSLRRGIPFLPEAFDILGRFAEELNGRSGVKSILTLNTLAAAGEKFQILELVMEEGKELDRVFHELDDFVFTGKHWVLTEMLDQAPQH